MDIYIISQKDLYVQEVVLQTLLIKRKMYHTHTSSYIYC